MKTEEELIQDCLNVVRRMGGKPQLTCGECGNKFTVPNKGRIPAFCTTKCRVRHHRRKKKETANEKVS